MFVITRDVAVIKNAAAPTLSEEGGGRGGGISLEQEHNKSPSESRPWRPMVLPISPMTLKPNNRRGVGVGVGGHGRSYRSQQTRSQTSSNAEETLPILTLASFYLAILRSFKE